jgi:outer membrane protein assembly factor BamB
MLKYSRFLVGVFALVLAASACSENSETSGNEAASNTTRPCAEQGQPALAAYDRKNGKLQWAVCGSEDVRRTVLVATEKQVYLTEYHRSGSTRSTAFDAATGKPAPGAEIPTIPLSTGPYEGTVIDNVRITGGQDDPTFATDASTGKLLWSQPGSPPYDDVWAIADGAVFVLDSGGPARPAQLVAYELKSGATRWARKDVDPYGPSMGWPWHAEGKDLFTIWSNLAVLSTSDGHTRWGTNYPKAEFPRMTGVRANTDLVFVAFSSIPSGGD